MISSRMAALIVAVALVASGATAVTGVSAQMEEEFAGEEMMTGNMTGGNMTAGENMTEMGSGNISGVSLDR
jgi:hypothetical protein